MSFFIICILLVKIFYFARQATLIVNEIGDENPFAVLAPALITNEQREKAVFRGTHKNVYDSGQIQRCRKLAADSVRDLPLSPRDHLCCGNSASVEYYMTAGRREEAGKLLSAMYERSIKENGYRYMGYDYNNSVTASLFYGSSGTGCEMLRYACP
ncbi:MAG: hypothetical protein J6N15_02860 [Ruminiclostridium sp.]|nr:hypothetical protein [Ruminiclostridium sp.]